MNKIVCDICGSTYPETAEQCPICGSSREFAIEGIDLIPDKMPEYVPDTKKKTGIFSAAAKMAKEEFYEMDAPEYDLPMDILPELGPEVSVESGPKRHISYFAIVLFSMLIGACVITSAFLLFRYFLPHQLSWETEPKQLEIEQTVTETTLPEETVIPCTSIVLTSGVPELTRIGQYWLLHVLVMPEDSTDHLTFTSSDESIVTVTPEGRLCAVGEGTTTVVISCGAEQILCQVTVKLPQEETMPETQTRQTEAETMSESEDAEDESPVVLKLKRTVVSFTRKGVTYQLELDCDLKPEDVSWMTLDPDVAICHDGLVTVLGNGVTKIVAQYGDQQVYCIIRCDFA